MRSPKLWIAGGAALVLAAAVVHWRRQSPAPTTDAEEEAELSKPAADFKYPDLDGKSLALSSFKGKTVLLDFWATWCGPCIQDIPGLEAMETKYKDRGFAVLGVSIDDASRKEVAAFARDKKINYPVVVTGGQDKIPEGYDVFGLPTAYLIDASGVVRRKYYGPKDAAAVSKDIEDVLGHATGKG